MFQILFSHPPYSDAVLNFPENEGWEAEVTNCLTKARLALVRSYSEEEEKAEKAAMDASGDFYSQAESHLAKVVSPKATFWLARLQQETGKHQEARQTCVLSIRDKQLRIDIATALGYFALENGDIHDAFDFVQIAGGGKERTSHNMGVFVNPVLNIDKVTHRKHQDALGSFALILLLARCSRGVKHLYDGGGLILYEELLRHDPGNTALRSEALLDLQKTGLDARNLEYSFTRLSKQARNCNDQHVLAAFGQYYFFAKKFHEAKKYFLLANQTAKALACRAELGELDSHSDQEIIDLFRAPDNEVRNGESLSYAAWILLKRNSNDVFLGLMDEIAVLYPLPNMMHRYWFLYMEYFTRIASVDKASRQLTWMCSSNQFAKKVPEIISMIGRLFFNGGNIIDAAHIHRAFKDRFTAYDRMIDEHKKMHQECPLEPGTTKLAEKYFIAGNVSGAMNILKNFHPALTLIEETKITDGAEAPARIAGLLEKHRDAFYIMADCIEKTCTDEFKLISFCKFWLEQELFVFKNAGKVRQQHEGHVKKIWFRMILAMLEKNKYVIIFNECRNILKEKWSKKFKEEILEFSEKFILDYLGAHLTHCFSMGLDLVEVENFYTYLPAQFPELSRQIKNALLEIMSQFSLLIQRAIPALDDEQLLQKLTVQLAWINEYLLPTQPAVVPDSKSITKKKNKKKKPIPQKKIIQDGKVPDKEEEKSSEPAPVNLQGQAAMELLMQALQLIPDESYCQSFVVGSSLLYFLKNRPLPRNADIDVVVFYEQGHEDELASKFVPSKSESKSESKSKSEGFVERRSPREGARLFRHFIADENNILRKIDVFCTPVASIQDRNAFLEVDSPTRGFTISQLYLSRAGEILDLDGRGRSDLENNRLSMCKGVDPSDYFRLDPVSILRALKCMAEGYLPEGCDIADAICAWEKAENMDMSHLNAKFCGIVNNPDISIVEIKMEFDRLLRKFGLYGKMFGTRGSSLALSPEFSLRHSARFLSKPVNIGSGGLLITNDNTRQFAKG